MIGTGLLARVRSLWEGVRSASPLTQVPLGVIAGALRIGLLIYVASSGHWSPKGVTVLAGYALVMLAVCLLACVVPTRRALRVQPTEALRAE